MDIREKINHLLRINQITQQELANQTGISKQLINSICVGKIKNSKALYPIAKFFNIEYAWLIKKEIAQNEPRKEDILILDKFHKIPLITTTLLSKKLLINGKLSLEEISTDYELTNDPEYSSMFCLQTTNNSLKFHFGNKCTLIFHTNIQPDTGDFVIAYLPDKELFVYRYLKVEKHKKILTPVDEDIYKPLIIRDIDRIVAVLYEKRMKCKIIN